MSETNPSQASESRPTSHTAGAATGADGNFVAGGRSVEAAQGWEWIAAGFRLFKQQPGIWILLLVSYVACSALIALVPLVGSIANVLL